MTPQSAGPRSSTTRVLYLVHDLADAAVRRRVAMLRAGGAEVDLAGFRRSFEPVAAVEDVHPIDLGRTRDADFAQRALKVAAAAATLGRRLAGAGAPDVILARNLEMLALGVRVRAREPRLVYESLDIHRLLLRGDLLGRSMRAMERRLMSGASMLVTSSPAFAREYFRPVQNVDKPILLVENRMLDIDGRAGAAPAPRSALRGRVLRIGWFGALRCAKSLDLLSAVTRRLDGRVEVVLRGRPARTEFDDFDGRVAAEPHLTYGGPYRAEDLASIYGDVDLVWAVDFFEEGLNSRWLLPNRLYEGCAHGRVPIAIAGTETARFLEARGIGLVLPDADPASLETLLAGLTGARLAALSERVSAVDRSAFVAGRGDCCALVAALRDGPPAERTAREAGHVLH